MSLAHAISEPRHARAWIGPSPRGGIVICGKQALSLFGPYPYYRGRSPRVLGYSDDAKGGAKRESGSMRGIARGTARGTYSGYSGYSG